MSRTYKKNWAYNDVIPADDLNRIEKNIEDVDEEVQQNKDDIENNAETLRQHGETIAEHGETIQEMKEILPRYVYGKSIGIKDNTHYFGKEAGRLIFPLTTPSAGLFNQPYLQDTSVVTEQNDRFKILKETEDSMWMRLYLLKFYAHVEPVEDDGMFDTNKNVTVRLIGVDTANNTYPVIETTVNASGKTNIHFSHHFELAQHLIREYYIEFYSNSTNKYKLSPQKAEITVEYIGYIE